jgi:methylmalonyl-CoA/ethylmalonyl-CoA epimerase
MMKLASNGQKIPLRAALLTAFLALPTLPAGAQSGPPSEARSAGAGFDMRIDHVGISVANLEESVNWYVEKLGFELTRPITRNPDSPTAIARIKRGNFTIELFEIKGAAPLPEYRRNPTTDLRVHGLAHFAFEVDDAMAAVKDLESKGVEIVLRPRKDELGRTFFFVSDNSGNTFEFIQP